MRLLRLLPVLLALACANFAQTNTTESTSGCAQAPPPGPDLKTRIDMLLTRETEALDRLQHQYLPAMRCDQENADVRAACRSFVGNLGERAGGARKEIAAYRRQPQPAKLFDVYTQLRDILEEIEIFMTQDQFNGDVNKQALAQSYNSFIKLTGVWFSGEMRNTMASLAPPK